MRQAIQSEFDIKLVSLVGAKFLIETQTDTSLLNLVDTPFVPQAIRHTGMSKKLFSLVLN
jgi:thiamine kinase-like enzyme